MPYAFPHQRPHPEDPESHDMLIWAMDHHQLHMMLDWVKRHPSESLDMALIYAVHSENTPALEALVRVAHVPITVAMMGGRTLLHDATVDQKYRSMDCLIKLGMDPNVQDLRGNTALHDALKKNHNRAARQLIKAGTNVNLVNKIGQLPLHIALKQHATLPVVQALIDRTTAWEQMDLYTGHTPLLNALLDYGQPKILMPMMARGASVSQHLRSLAPHSQLDVSAFEVLNKKSYREYRHFADQGLALYEQQVLRTTLNAPTVTSDGLDVPHVNLSTPTPPRARPRL